jgi:hypothetical protein
LVEAGKTLHREELPEGEKKELEEQIDAIAADIWGLSRGELKVIRSMLTDVGSLEPETTQEDSLTGEQET